ncbi:MAG: alpha/beta fold hydrolase, partial [Aliifodinibius sp.]|nr:alpha/beta fold hydrolase [Fodinibius sp.]
VGISMGGGLSLGLTLKFPDSIERLILVDSYGLGKKIPGGILSYLTVHIPLLNDLLRFTLQRQKKLVQWGLRNLIHNTNAINEELVSDAWQSLREAGRHKTWRSFLKHEINPGGFRTNYVNQLKDVHKPTLIIHGKNDRLFPVKWAERAHQLMPESKLKIIPNCGHIPPREKPEEFNRLVIEYLRKTVM